MKLYLVYRHLGQSGNIYRLYNNISLRIFDIQIIVFNYSGANYERKNAKVLSEIFWLLLEPVFSNLCTPSGRLSALCK